MKSKIWIIISFVLVALLGSLAALNRERLFNNLNWGKKDCVPYNARMDDSNGLTVSWNTESKCTGIVKFGSNMENLQYWSNSQLKDGRYTAALDTSKYEGVRYVVIISDGVGYGIDGKAIKVN